MATHDIDLATWSRKAQFDLFRTFEKPHYAVTSRVDVTHLLARKAHGVSSYRGCLYAIGVGIHAVPELLTRFRGQHVVRHDRVELSMTVPTQAGNYAYAYVPYDPDFAVFDANAGRAITAAAAGADLAPNLGDRDDMAYLSCMPWLDYTSMNNAMPGPQECIPRVAWGKFTNHEAWSDMAMTLEVHHALVDGAHIGAFFAAVQAALNDI